MTNTIEIKIPDIGGFDAVEVIEVMVAVGDKVNKEDSLITVESDKASMEIPSTASGIVKSLQVKVGDKVSEGSVIMTLDAEQETSNPAAAKTKLATNQSAAPVLKEITVPDIGDFKEVEVIEVLVAIGDQIKKEQSLVTLESDKASMEIPSTDTGSVKEIKVKVGDKIAQGAVILTLLVDESSASAAPAKTAAVESAPPKPSSLVAQTASRPAPTSSLPMMNESGFRKAHASPATRKFARELGADLGQVKGSGPKGRILKEDIIAWVKAMLTSMATGHFGGGVQVAELPKVDFKKFGDIEVQPLTKINKLTGKFLHRSWFYIPHVTQFDEADITELDDYRKVLTEQFKKDNIKITFLAFLLKAVVATLKEFPRFNASLDNEQENLILKKYFHIGVAVDTPEGLVVPVVRDVNKKSLPELAKELAEMAGRARDKKITPTEMQGACFTISSLGGIGGTAFTPIVNLPEVAILGVSKVDIKPKYNGKEFLPRKMLPLSLSYDHRVIDGVAAAKFTTFLAAALADAKKLAE